MVASVKKKYKELLGKKILDFIAITDHQRIDEAIRIQKLLGKRIIVGEEIKTTKGDVIGLYLNRPIPNGLSPKSTVKKIKQQKGLVYIPHPNNPKTGLPLTELKLIKENLDIIEVFNARTKIPYQQKVLEFAKKNNIGVAAGSDSHCNGEIGRTYSKVNTAKSITRLNLAGNLAKAKFQKTKAAPYHLLCPSINRIKHVFR